MMRRMSENKDISADLAAPDSGKSGRRGLLWAAGALAASAGLGVAWWRLQATGATPGEALFDGFWAQQWDAPQGAPVHMQAFRGKPLLINFWATWCPPCIEELPAINAFFQKNHASGWQVLGLAVDRPSAVQGFLQKMPLDFPVALAGANGTQLANQLGNPSGALPFSLAIGAQGAILQRKLGRLREQDLESWARLK
jgi:thiol-disulfide isomerase/thioredoxin